MSETVAPEEEDLAAWASDDDMHAAHATFNGHGAPETHAQPGSGAPAASATASGIGHALPSSSPLLQAGPHAGSQVAWLPRHVPPSIAAALENDLRRFSITEPDQAIESEIHQAIHKGMQRAIHGKQSGPSGRPVASASRDTNTASGALGPGRWGGASIASRDARSTSAGRSRKGDKAATWSPGKLAAPSIAATEGFQDRMHLLTGKGAWQEGLRDGTNSPTKQPTSPQRRAQSPQRPALQSGGASPNRRHQGQVGGLDSTGQLPPHLAARLELAKNEVRAWAQGALATAEARLGRELERRVLALVDEKTQAHAQSRAFACKVRDAIAQMEVVLAQLQDEERQVEVAFDGCCDALRDTMAQILADYRVSIEGQARARLAQLAAANAAALL